MEGRCDDIPEQAFLYCGSIDDVYEKARKIQEASSAAAASVGDERKNPR